MIYNVYSVFNESEFMKNTTSLNLNKLKKKYDENGFVLIKNFINRKDCKNALNWLKRKNKRKLVKSWTEKEPGVEAAVYSVFIKTKSNF